MLLRCDPSVSTDTSVWRLSRGWARELNVDSYLRLISQVVMDSASKSHLGISAAPVPLLVKGSAFERLADSGGRSILGEGESAWKDRAKMLSQREGASQVPSLGVQA